MDHVTPYDRFARQDENIERWLATGAHRDELRAFFGGREYRSLSILARRARVLGVNPRHPRVLLLPGIMGSQLGVERATPLPHDILWLDPLDIHGGRLSALRLPDRAPMVPLGIVLFSYLRLKLYLRSRGFAVEAYDYDWRLPVVQLGRRLAAHLYARRGTRTALVAHSMGGLLVRAALAQPGTAHVQRAVLLGTPHLGSFAAVQALRGTYAVVRKVARLDARASAEELSSKVFSSFPSLYDLLPSAPPGVASLLQARGWPRTGPRPRASLLRAARRDRSQLGALDQRYTLIAGVGQETVTALSRRGEDFVYTLTRGGDGTVPVASAAPPGAPCLYAPVAHSDLTRDPMVAAAVVDLLVHGTSARLPNAWKSGSRAQVQVSDGQLRRTHVGKVDWAALGPEQRRLFLENLNEPPHLRLRVRAGRGRTRAPR
ncbi:MAG TPA: alpha/beta fold hydrolase [Steroidobacteraceae bacterium]